MNHSTGGTSSTSSRTASAIRLDIRNLDREYPEVGWSDLQLLAGHPDPHHDERVQKMCRVWNAREVKLGRYSGMNPIHVSTGVETLQAIYELMLAEFFGDDTWAASWVAGMHNYPVSLITTYFDMALWNLAVSVNQGEKLTIRHDAVTGIPAWMVEFANAVDEYDDGMLSGDLLSQELHKREYENSPLTRAMALANKMLANKTSRMDSKAIVAMVDIIRELSGE